MLVNPWGILDIIHTSPHTLFKQLPTKLFVKSKLDNANFIWWPYQITN